jgi:Protein of unknown function (DUF4054)
MITFQTFAIKYPEFKDEPIRFTAFLPDAVIEVGRYRWGNLVDVATELLVAHKISLSSPHISNDGLGFSSGSVKRIEVQDDRYEVEYQDQFKSSNSSSDYASTRYGAEYLRLLKMITGTAEEKPPVNNYFNSTSYVGRRGENTLPW